MIGSLLMRGIIAGVLAGLLAFGFAKIFGEPQVDRAISFETQLSMARGEAPEPELVSRKVQSGLGLLTGVLVYGTGIGGLFALTFASTYGRFGRLTPRATAILLALGGFTAIILVPFLKYPANPPAIGDASTIGYRTGLYFLMIVISLLSMGVAVLIGRRFTLRQGIWNSVLLAAGSFLALVAAAQLLLPDLNEVPEHFPPVVLWRFRMASLGIHAVLWTSLGLLFGYLAETVLGETASPGIAKR